MLDEEKFDAAIGEKYPQLLRIDFLSLDDSALCWTVRTHRDRLVLGWAKAAGCRTVGDLAQCTAREVAAWRSVGQAKFLEILALCERLHLDAEQVLVMSAAAGDSYPDEHTAEGLREVKEHPEPTAVLLPAIVVEWASVTVGATTVEQVLQALGRGSLPTDVAVAWAQFLAAPAIGPVMPDLVSTLLATDVHDVRVLDVLERRVLSPKPLTLDELGRVHDITRERVRQLEQKALRALRANYAENPFLNGMRWLGHQVVREIGACAPAYCLDDAVPVSDDLTRRFLVLCEGYRREGDLLLEPGFVMPALTEVPFLDSSDLVVDVGELVDTLSCHGVREKHMDAVLGAIEGLTWRDDSLVRAPRSLLESAVTVLLLRGEPMDVLDLHTEAAPEKSYAGFRDRLFSDPRVVRVSRTEVGLADWGLEEYGGISDAMIKACQEDEWLLEDLAVELATRFGVSENSVRMYASAPCFRLVDGYLELRPSDDPYVPREKPCKVTGLFVGRDGEVRWNVLVDRDILRGSGRSLPQEIATWFGLSPGGRLAVSCSLGEVRLSWPVTSHIGPSMGSIKSHAQALGAEDGALLQTIWHADSQSVEIRALPSDPNASGHLEWLAEVTGIDNWGSPEDAIAAAICSSGDPIDALERRGDHMVATLVRDLL